MKFILSKFGVVAVLFLLSCQSEQVKQKMYSKKPKTIFNIEEDISHFSDELDTYDTLKILMNRSMCTYYGFERILLIKNKEGFTIYIENTTKNLGRDAKPEWQLVCRKKIGKDDKILKEIEQFFAKNKFRQFIKGKPSPTLQVNYHKKKLNYYTEGFLYDKAMFEGALDSITFKICPKLIKQYGPVEVDH